MTASQQVTSEFYYLLNVKIVLVYGSDQMHLEDVDCCKYPYKELKINMLAVCLCILMYSFISN